MTSKRMSTTGMLNKKGIWSALFICLFISAATASADGIQDYVLTKLDGQGSVDSVDVTNRKIVISDRSYSLSRNVTVFDVSKKRNSSIERVKVGDNVGFKSKPLPNPTAPYDQLIVKLWILK